MTLKGVMIAWKAGICWEIRLIASTWVCLGLFAVESHGENKQPKPVDPAGPGQPLTLQDAVRLTLGRSPRIKIQEQENEVRRGEVLVRSSAFDTRIGGNGSHGSQRREILRVPQTASNTTTAQALPTIVDTRTGQTTPLALVPPPAPVVTNQPGPATVTEENVSDFDVGIRKRLRNGSEVGAQAIYSRRNPEPGGPVFNTSELRFTVQVPLLRMFSPSDEASFERAAKINYTGSLLTSRHVLTEAVFETARAYWALRAAQERLELLRQSEATSESFVRLTNILIEADERPKTEIYQVNARVGEAATRRISAEQDVLEARQRLGVLIGLNETELRSAPIARENFPSTAGLARAGARRDYYISEAFKSRADYMASLKNEQSTHVLLAAARRNLLPRLDFQLRTSYFGGEVGSRGENISGSFFGNQTGLSAIGVISLDWPLENRLARGQVVQSGAQHEQAIIRTDDLRRNIASNVITSLGALVNAYFQLQQAEQAVAAYRDAFETEKLRFEAADATLLDVIVTEERLTNALLSVISARQQAAEAYARLRFETGTMFSGEGPDLTLPPGVLTSLPPVDGGPSTALPDFKASLKPR